MQAGENKCDPGPFDPSNYQTSLGFDIRDVFLTGAIVEMNNFAQLFREQRFPVAMPICFIFPPRITVRFSMMSPMPGDFATTFRPALSSARGTKAAKLRFWQMALVIYKGVLHWLKVAGGG